MAVRTIEYTVSESGLNPSTLINAGVQGEHNATEVVFDVTELVGKLPTNDGTIYYHIEGRNGTGTKKSTVPAFFDTTIPDDDGKYKIAYNLENWLTRDGGLVTVRLVFSIVDDDNETELVLYTFDARLELSANNGYNDDKEYKGVVTLYKETLAAYRNATNEAVSAEQSANDAKASENVVRGFEQQYRDYLRDAETASVNAESAKQSAEKAMSVAVSCEELASEHKNAAEQYANDAQYAQEQAIFYSAQASENANIAIDNADRAESAKTDADISADASRTSALLSLKYALGMDENGNVITDGAKQYASQANDAKQKAEEAKGAAEKARDEALNAVGNKEYSVQYIKQSLTEEQQTQARENIDAASTEALRDVATVLKWQKSGFSARIENAEQNPLDMSIDVIVQSKNILDYTKFSLEQNTSTFGVTFEDNGNGSVTLIGTSTGAYTLELLSAENCPFEVGKTYTISKLHNAPSGVSLVVLYKQQGETTNKSFSQGVTFTWLENYEFVKVYLVVSKGTNLDGGDGYFTAYPQIEEGKTATEYMPYVVDLTQVPVHFFDDQANDIDILKYPNANGVVENVFTAQPETNIVPYNDKQQKSVIVTATYTPNINYVIEEIRQAIISLGGNV